MLGGLQWGHGDPGRRHLDDVPVRHVDPALVVVERLAGQERPGVGGDTGEGVAPGRRDQPARPAEQQVQPGVRVRRRRPSRPSSASRSTPSATTCAASSAASHTDSASGRGAAARSGPPDRCARPASRRAGTARSRVSSIGMPSVAERTAATTRPELSAGATEANEASCHSGRVERHRASSPSGRCEAHAPAVRVEQAEPLPARPRRTARAARAAPPAPGRAACGAHRASPGAGTLRRPRPGAGR